MQGSAPRNLGPASAGRIVTVGGVRYQGERKVGLAEVWEY